MGRSILSPPLHLFSATAGSIIPLRRVTRKVRLISILKRTLIMKNLFILTQWARCCYKNSPCIAVSTRVIPAPVIDLAGHFCALAPDNNLRRSTSIPSPGYLALRSAAAPLTWAAAMELPLKLT
ncbi:hypothetical protein N752_04775 [Desulforamulus aquiferis]|nr:hypothetical protein N752_04775 [Desulforamulus aquiferis]